MEAADSIFSYLQKIPKAFYLPIGLSIIGVVLFGYGLIYLLSTHNSRENFSVDKFSQASTSAQLASNKLTVDVEGAVVSRSLSTFTGRKTARGISGSRWTCE